MAASVEGDFSKQPHWDAAVADYEAHGEPFTRQYAEAALALAGGVHLGERVIDVTAGTGALALLAARAGADVLGADFSSGMVARLAERFRAEGHQACEARVMDGQALDVADGRFDAAFSVFGVIMFPDWARGLAELARITRPGGRVCVAVWAHLNGGGPSPLISDAFRAMFPEVSPPTPPGMVRLHDPAGLAEEMRSAVLAEVKVHRIDGVWDGGPVERLAETVDRLQRLIPLYARLDEGDRARLSEAVSRLMAEYATPDGIRVPPTAYAGVGRR